MLIATYTTALAQQTNNIQHLSALDFKKAIESKKYLVIDVRTPAEFKQGHITGALNIDMSVSSFQQLIKKATSQNKSIAIYCRSGRRSKAAIANLNDLKLQIIELNTGINGWIEAGYNLSNDK